MTVVAAILTVFRVALAANTPLVPNMDQLYDDALLMGYAKSLAAGNWLGEYGWLTLAKRPGFSLFLALPTLTGVSYQVLFIAAYIAAAIAFVVSIRPLIPSRCIRLGLYCLLLFLPALFTWELFQRVYRMSIVIPFVMMVFSCYIGVYLRRDEPLPRLLPWVALLSVSMPLFYIMKEDSIWIAPFVLVVSALVVGHWLIGVVKKRDTLLGFTARTLLVALPVLCVAALVAVLGAKNYEAYGERTICERSDGSFSRAMSELVSVDAGDSDRVVWLTRSALLQALDQSPSLAAMQAEVLEAWDNWGSPEGEVPGDHAYWALLDAYTRAGLCVSGKETDRYWNAVANELHEAFAQGSIARKGGLKISSSVQPIQPKDVLPWMRDTFAHTKMMLSLVLANTGWGPGTGSQTDQLAVQEFLKGPCLTEETVEETRATYEWALTFGAKWVEMCRFIAIPMTYLMFVPLAFVLYGAIRRRDKAARTALLIVAGLALSCFCLVAAVAWFIAFLGDSSEWAAYMYSAGFYPLCAMAESILVGLCFTRLCEHLGKSARSKRAE